MKNTIQEIGSMIVAKSNQLATETKSAITKTGINRTPPATVSASKDDPSRPWMLTSGACVLTGVIGAMASDSKWPYLIGAMGLVSLGVGYKKRKLQEASYSKQDISDISLDKEKVVIIENCNLILDSAKKEWDSFMDSVKMDIQRAIKQSSLSEEKKDEYIALTYYPETLSLSTLPLIDGLESVGDSIDNILLKKSDFANEVARNIIHTANRQVEIYNKITL